MVNLIEALRPTFYGFQVGHVARVNAVGARDIGGVNSTALLGEGSCDGLSDAGCSAEDNNGLVLEMEVHGERLFADGRNELLSRGSIFGESEVDAVSAEGG